MATRLSKINYRNIALGAALKYTRDADSIMGMSADTIEYYPEFRHVQFDRKEAEDQVWHRAVQEIGEKRAEALSSAQFNELVKYALQEFDRLVASGYCHKQGFTTVRDNSRRSKQ